MNPECEFCLLQAAGVLLREHSNRPVSAVKIGLACVKPAQCHRYNTHFASLIMRQSPLRVQVYKECLPIFALLTLLIVSIFLIALRF